MKLFEFGLLYNLTLSQLGIIDGNDSFVDAFEHRVVNGSSLSVSAIANSTILTLVLDRLSRNSNDTIIQFADDDARVFFTNFLVSLWEEDVYNQRYADQHDQDRMWADNRLFSSATFVVDRHDLYNSSKIALENMSGESVESLKVRFKDEEGQDAGGLTRFGSHSNN
jgi:hypothetical protein